MQRSLYSVILILFISAYLCLSHSDQSYGNNRSVRSIKDHSILRTTNSQNSGLSNHFVAASRTWEFVGEATENHFGYCVASAGDVNGDGYDDLISGAYGSDNYRGKALIFYGSFDGPSSNASWVRYGEMAGDKFGNFVSSAGDVNNDGYDDVVIGSPGFGANGGKAYLFLGSSAGVSQNFSWSFVSENIENYLGLVASAGDINNDGYDDVIVGAPGFSSFKGKTYLFLGSQNGLSTLPEWTAEGEAVQNYFGFSVSCAGDVNGDNYDDVIISTNGYDGNLGKAYSYYGSPTGLSNVPDWTGTDNIPESSYGYRSSGAGDINGDGFDDVIVGALAFSESRGRAYVYYGGTNGISALPSVILDGVVPGDEFGYSVSSAGDINDDGYSDILIGADGVQNTTGRVYMYYGSPDGINSLSSEILDGFSDSRFGSWVSNAGDINGDGYDDIVVGAHKWNYYKGKVLAFAGSRCGNLNDIWSAQGETIFSRFGYSLDGPGDTDGDGKKEFITAGYDWQSGTGKAYLYEANQSDSCNPRFVGIWTKIGEAPASSFGSSVSFAGDVNNDGYSDLIIGASGYGRGKAYLFPGSVNGPSDIPSWTYAGEVTGAYLGESAGAGDVNNDGYDDVIVGSPGYSGFRGKAYLFFGSSDGLLSSPAWTATGESSGNYFGNCVASAGDVNNDGYSDVIVATNGYGGNLSKVYVYYGSLTGLPASPDWTAGNKVPGSSFGYSSASAGDVNGDGYDDIIIGELGYESSTGRAYLYLGGPNGVSPDPAWTKNGIEPGSEFGYCVGTVGDADGDGKSDVFVGADGNDSESGSIAVFRGTSSGLADNYSWYFAGGNEYGRFGSAATGMGDANGDGSIDIIVGAYKSEYYNGKVLAYQLDLSVVSVNPIESTVKPDDFALLGNYPNPFNPATLVRYFLPRNSLVKLDVFDISGRHVVNLINSKETAGTHEVSFDGSDFASGIYFCKMEAGEYYGVIKMMLIK